MERQRREQLRWYLLLATNLYRPFVSAEASLQGTAQGIFPDVTALETRRELDYLEDRGLLTIERLPSGPWQVSITRHGVDIVEYTIDCEPGIARPPKTW